MAYLRPDAGGIFGTKCAYIDIVFGFGLQVGDGINRRCDNNLRDSTSHDESRIAVGHQPRGLFGTGGPGDYGGVVVDGFSMDTGHW